MAHVGLDVWGRVVRDPYTLLLGAAATVQAALASSGHLQQPMWALVALGVFVAVCALVVVSRLRPVAFVDTAAPFALLLIAAMWRAAGDPGSAGFGGVCIVAVVWLGFYAARWAVLLAVVGAFGSMLLGSALSGEQVSGDDWRRAALTGAVALLVGPTISSLVQSGARSEKRLTVLEPASLRLEAVLRAATGNMIVVFDADGVIIEFNQGAERLLGYRAEEVVGKPAQSLFHDPDVGLELFNHAPDRGEVETRDWTYLTKDARRIIVSMSITAIRDDAGRITGYVGIGTDVTATRATIETLAAQREIYRLLVQHLPMTTVGLFDKDLRCVTIGGHYLNKVGAEPSTFHGKSAEDFFRPPDRARAREFYERGLVEPMSVQWELSDGKTYEFAVLPLDGPGGETLVLSVARDVTEVRNQDRLRHEMDAALAVSEASFREAFEGAPIGMALITVADGPDEKFLRVNPAFAAILGRRPEELVGLRVADVTHPEDVALQPDLAHDAPARTLRKRFMRPSGRAVWVEVSYAVVRDADGVPSHVIKQIQDIHTIKESERALLDALEQQRAATARLRELDRIRTDLVGTISHELRTPLTSVHGYLELLGDEPLSATQRGMLDVAIRNTERLAALVDNLLVLVRLDSIDESDLMGTDDVDLATAISAAVDTVRPEFVDCDQELTVNLPIEPAVVRGDFDQIDRVLVNLLSNASKYTPDGGRIDVNVALTSGADVRIVIADTGIGIPADEVPHLFNRFFRASTARANSISGNGLGLAIVKSIIERHGGEVSVDSELGQGSRFSIILPLAGRHDAPAPSETESVGGQR